MKLEEIGEVVMLLTCLSIVFLPSGKYFHLIEGFLVLSTAVIFFLAAGKAKKKVKNAEIKKEQMCDVKKI